MDELCSADLHLGHRTAAEKFRPFESVEEMNDRLVTGWNETVRPGDRVWLLGDAVMGVFLENVHLLGQLHGEIHLVPGNHDRVHPAYEEHRAHKRAEFRAAYEQYVTIEPLVVEHPAGVLLCHFPYTGDHTDEDRYPEHRPHDDGRVLLHGHVHDLWRVNGRQVNVGVDVHDFRPIPLEAAIALAETTTT